MKIEKYFDDQLAHILPEVAEKGELLEKIAELCAPLLPDIENDDLLTALLERERLHSTAQPEGVAFPHALIEKELETCIAIFKYPKGIDFEDQKNTRVDLLFVLIGSKTAAWEHFRILARLGRLCHIPSFVAKLRQAKEAQQLLEIIKEEDRLHV